MIRTGSMHNRGRKGLVRLFAFLCAFGVVQVLVGEAKQVDIPVEEYGMIVSRDMQAIKGATVEKVRLYSPESANSSKKIVRHGVLVRYKDAVGTLLLCHGFMCDKTDENFLRRLVPKGRFNVMSFDFRAHGENKEGQCCTLGRDEAYDVITAAHFLRSHPSLKGKPVFVYGFSMGAVASIEAQSKDSSLFDAMILDCPFDSSENVIKRGLENLKITLFGYTFDLPGKSLLQRYAFHPYVQSMLKMVLKVIAKFDSHDIILHALPTFPVQSIVNVTVPTFLIHCKNDEKVSVDAVTSIFNNSGATNKTLWLTNGRGHYDSFFYNPEGYTEKVRKFLEDAINGTLRATRKKEMIVDKQEAPLEG